MAKLTSQEKEERRLKEILRAYQTKQPLVSPASDAAHGPASPPSPRADLPQFDAKSLKSDLAKSLLLTLISLGLLVLAFFFLS